MTTIEDRKKEILTKDTTAVLVETLRNLDGLPERTMEETMALAWVCDELERRYPAVNEALDAWVEVTAPERVGTYAKVLIEALPPEARKQKIQPRYQAFLDQVGGGTNVEYMAWVTAKLNEWRKLVGLPEDRRMLTEHHEAFTEWLVGGGQ